MMRHLDKMLEPTAESLGYELVRVTLLGSERKILQVMAERGDGEPMTVSDCEALSRALSAVLDVEDPIPGRYDLEVSSPGIDRPLTRPKDFARFAGHEARIELDRVIDGHRRVKGVLLGIDDDRTISLKLAGDGTTFAMPFGAVTKAKLLLTDALIAEALRAAKKAQAKDGGDDGEGPADAAGGAKGPVTEGGEA